MAQLNAFRPNPLIPHRAVIDDFLHPDCGHLTDLTCDGCVTCTACDGCYCSSTEEDEPPLSARFRTLTAPEVTR